MKAQADERHTPSAARRWPVRLLLAGDEDELNSDIMHRTFDGSRRVMIARSASLLGALERMQTERADVILLSQTFRDEEVAAFLSNARRAGFRGLILRVASTAAFSLGAGDASLTAGLRNTSLQFMRAGRDLPRQHETSILSFTPRQRTVLARVAEGWTNAQVARHLECTEGAIKATLQQIFKKLGVRKRSQVVRVAMEQKLVEQGGAAAPRVERRSNRAPLLVARSPVKGKEGFHVGDFVIDIAMHRVWVRGTEIHLTPSEFELLEVFAAHSEELVRSTALCEMFWRNPTAKQDSLRVLIRGLRAKIEVCKVPQYIVTERNFGYRFHPSLARSKGSKNLV
jgi:DNA-binding response OmpR family regulator